MTNSANARLGAAGLIAVLATALCLAPLQTAAQASAAPPAPHARAWPSLAYDPATHTTVLFGGTNWTRYNYGATWTWNGTVWRRQHPAVSPAARRGAAMAYDTATNQLLLFGGGTGLASTAGYAGDTWVWDGSNWTQLHPATSPPARQNPDMVYDAARQQIILFGGYDGGYLNDTWTWNGTTWSQQNPTASPSPRDTFSMAYDAAAQQTVLFGGWDGSANLHDTWAWDGTNWTQLHPATSPSVRAAGWQSAYDAATAQIVLFGGISNGKILNDTWAWNGSTWARLKPATSPPVRENGGMTYDSLRQRIVLFGGDNGSARTHLLSGPWEWNGATWRLV